MHVLTALSHLQVKQYQKPLYSQMTSPSAKTTLQRKLKAPHGGDGFGHSHNATHIKLDTGWSHFSLRDCHQSHVAVCMIDFYHTAASALVRAGYVSQMGHIPAIPLEGGIRESCRNKR